MSTIKLKLIKTNPLTLQPVIALKRGYFKKYNVDVSIEILEDFLFDGNDDFLKGNVDATVGDLTFLFYWLEQGKKAVITSTLTRTISLIGSKNLPEDLTGIRVGANKAGLLPLFLENDLNSIVANTKIVWINNSFQRMKALDNGEIDALVAIEPFIGDVLDNGGKIIWSLRESKSNYVMWTFDEEFYNNNKENVRNFHRALEEAGEYFNSLSSEDKGKIAVEVLGYNEKLANRAKSFIFEKQEKYSLEDFNRCQEWMFRDKLIKKLYSGEKIIKGVV